MREKGKQKGNKIKKIGEGKLNDDKGKGKLGDEKEEKEKVDNKEVEKEKS